MQCSQRGIRSNPLYRSLSLHISSVLISPTALMVALLLEGLYCRLLWIGKWVACLVCMQNKTYHGCMYFEAAEMSSIGCVSATTLLSRVQRPEGPWLQRRKGMILGMVLPPDRVHAGRMQDCGIKYVDGGLVHRHLLTVECPCQVSIAYCSHLVYAVCDAADNISVMPCTVLLQSHCSRNEIGWQKATESAILPKTESSHSLPLS